MSEEPEHYVVMGQLLAHIEPVGGSPRSFVAVLASSLLLLLTGTVSTNVIVDPRNEFDHQFFRPIAVTDEPIKLERWAQSRAQVQTVLFGSSTMRQMDTNDLEREGFPDAFNFAVGGGDLSTDERLARVALEGTHVTHVIVGVDRLFLLEPALHPDRLLTFTYVRDSVRAVIYSFKSPPPSQYVYGDFGDLVRPSGAHPDAFPAGLSDEERVSAIQGYLDERWTQYNGSEVREGAWGHLQYLAGLGAEGVAVDLVLMPMHPIMAEGLDAHYGPAFMQNLRARLPTLCAAGVRVHDLYDVTAWGDEGGFTDGIHFREPTTDQFWAMVAKGDHDVCGTAA